MEFAIRRLLDQLPLGPGNEGGRESGEVKLDREGATTEAGARSGVPAAAHPAPLPSKIVPEAVGVPVPRPPPTPAPVGLEAFSKTEIQQLTIQAWSFARTAMEAKDPVGVLREALRRVLTDMNRSDLSDIEIDRILQELADGSEKDRRPTSPTIQQVLGGRSRA